MDDRTTNRLLDDLPSPPTHIRKQSIQRIPWSVLLVAVGLAGLCVGVLTTWLLLAPRTRDSAHGTAEHPRDNDARVMVFDAKDKKEKQDEKDAAPPGFDADDMDNAIEPLNKLLAPTLAMASNAPAAEREIAKVLAYCDSLRGHKVHWTNYIERVASEPNDARCYLYFRPTLDKSQQAAVMLESVREEGEPRMRGPRGFPVETTPRTLRLREGSAVRFRGKIVSVHHSQADAQRPPHWHYTIVLADVTLSE